MRGKGLWGFVFLVVFIAGATAQEIAPVAVSPGSESGVAVVERRCPAFSWSSILWAVGYRVAVFEATTAEIVGYEAMAAAAAPVLTKEIQGQALSWTPSWRERLRDGGLYVWYVQALDGSGQGVWSAGRVFEVEVERNTEERLTRIDERVSRRLKDAGVSDDVVADVSREMKSGAEGKEIAKDFSLNGTLQGGPNTFRTQGTETAQRCFYGLNAGHDITTGGANTFIGTESGYFNTSAECNTFVGYMAGQHSLEGHSNTFMGYHAGQNNTTVQIGYARYSGEFNVFMGYRTGETNTYGSRNTFLGYRAGYSNQTGSGNVFLGYDAGYAETGSNKLYIDNSNTSSPLIYGDFTNNILTLNGKLGIGKTPINSFDILTSGTDATITAGRSGCAWSFLQAGTASGSTGTKSNHPFVIYVGGAWKMRLDADKSLLMASGATCTAGGVWTNSSSRQLKENIRDLTAEEARDTLGGLNPVSYNYKADNEEQYVGFIAEDVPELVATKDRKGLSPMDVVAVLTRVVQEQQTRIAKLEDTIKELQKKAK